MEVDDDFVDYDNDYDEEDDLDQLQNVQLRELWTVLQPRLDQIYDEDNAVDWKFMTQCYDLVFSYLMHVNRENIQKRIEGHQEIFPGKSHEYARDLHSKLISYMGMKTNGLTQIFRETPPDLMFQQYASYWTRFKSIHKKLQFIFRYLDRFYVPNERKDENVSCVLETYTFGMKQWFDNVFINCQDVLINEVMKFMKLDREGRLVDKKLISGVSRPIKIIFCILIRRFLHRHRKALLS